MGVGSLGPGVKADLTLIDLDRKWKVNVNQFYSKGRNCPFDGWELQGKAILTIVAGRVVFRDDVISDSNIDNVYAVTLLFEQQGLCKKVLKS